MKHPELLIPASSLEVLKTAVVFGADAVYIGGEAFGLRAKAKNFSMEEIQEGIAFAHAHDVKVYITANILAHNGDLSGVRAYFEELKEIKPDALIISDPGVFMIAREVCPEIDIHISTQANNTNYGTYNFWYNLGAKRVVTARELSMKEIKEIREHIPDDMEIETFVHGAMCVCYSGQCLMSSMIGKRSGNRGQCAQPCRLQYQLLKDGQSLPEKHPYLLSPKDIMTIEYLGELIEAGVSSLKIEGRMKRPEYVASVTRAYRQAIDAYYQNKKIDFQPYIQDMSAMFNRNYTSGYLHHDLKIVDGDYPGHKGYIIGEVVYYHKKQKRVGIRLTQPLLQGDSIVFEDIDKVVEM